MNRGIFIFLGVLATLALSFWGLIFIPQTQIGQQRARLIEETGEYYPAARSGLAQQGADVYRSQGCVECHSQQVRPRKLGTDIERNWGPRFTVAQDYVGDHPVMLGIQRVGPDLSNVGMRLRDADWHLRHLYEPRSVARGSIMPPYRYLFEKRQVPPGKARSQNALDIAGIPDGYEVVPRDSAVALVAYLLSLSAPVNLFEAPLPRQPGPDTNAPARNVISNATSAASSPPPPPPPGK